MYALYGSAVSVEPNLQVDIAAVLLTCVRNVHEDSRYVIIIFSALKDIEIYNSFIL